MIPILYESNESTFTSNGVCRLVDCVSCEVTEERNGIFECEFTYPITGRNYDKIKEGMIIYTTHDESGEPQPFDIYKRSVPIDGVVTFNAAHISYRLRNYILKPFTAASIAETFASLVPNATPASCPFTFWTDKEVESAFTLNVPKSIRSVLGGEEGSILDVYGTGEYEFDKFAVKLHLHRGQDTNVKIQYGKNLIDLTDETDAGNLYNAVVPYWLSSEEGAAPVMLSFPYYVTASDFDPETEHVIPIVLDLSSNFQEEPTAEQLAARARAVLDASETRKGTRTIEVDFVQLWQTEQYKDIAPLERLNLCDTVEVIYGGTSVAQKITTVVYDSLLDRYKSMELGATTQTLADALMASMERAISEPVKRAIDKTAASIKHATDMITGNEGGYVVLRMNDDGQPMELLICDTPDYLTAQNVWRWNQNGLGFSSTGYEGPYGTAITSDGTIIGNYVKTGVISALTGNSYFDLDNGIIYTEKSSTSIKNNSAIQIGNGRIAFIGSKNTKLDTEIGLIQHVNIGNVSATLIFPSYCFVANYGSIGFGHINPDGERTRVLDMWIEGIDQADSHVTLEGDQILPRLVLNKTCIAGQLFISRSNDPEQLVATLKSYVNGYSILRVHDGSLSGDGTKVAYLNSGGNPYGINKKSILLDAAIGLPLSFYNAKSSMASSETANYYGKISLINTDHWGIVTEQGRYFMLCGYDSNGTLAPCYIVNPSKVTYSGSNARNIFFENVYIEQDVSCQTLTQRSDGRYKTVLDWDDRFDVLIDKLRPVFFDWKNRDDDAYHHIGLIAQEVEKEMHALGLEDCIVHTSESGEKSIAYSEVSTLLLKKVQQQQKKIDDLEARLARIEALIGG